MRGTVSGTRAANRYGWVIVLIIVSYVTSVGADGTLGITVVMLFQLVTLWLVFRLGVVPGTADWSGSRVWASGWQPLPLQCSGHVLDVDSTAEKAISPSVRWRT